MASKLSWSGRGRGRGSYQNDVHGRFGGRSFGRANSGRGSYWYEYPWKTDNKWSIPSGLSDCSGSRKTLCFTFLFWQSDFCYLFWNPNIYPSCLQGKKCWIWVMFLLGIFRDNLFFIFPLRSFIQKYYVCWAILFPLYHKHNAYTLVPL